MALSASELFPGVHIGILVPTRHEDDGVGPVRCLQLSLGELNLLERECVSVKLNVPRDTDIDLPVLAELPKQHHFEASKLRISQYNRTRVPVCELLVLIQLHVGFACKWN